MTIKYINCKDKAYYLHSGTTKTGKARYYFSPKTEGTLAKTIPEGYEVYENPHGQVFIRKIVPQLVTEQEVETIERGMRKFSDVKTFKLAVKKGTITVFAGTTGFQSMHEILGSAFGNLPSITEAKLAQNARYSEELQFELSSKEQRTFTVNRFCYRGSVDDWISISGPDTLARQVQQYVKHIGKDSMFELF
jgi:hypothetical protein